MKKIARDKFIILFILILAINIFSIKISDALLDCSKCHTTDPGKSAIKAKDTIVINDNTCLACHNPKYPPTPIGYNTHLVHVGKFSAKVNFLATHPDIPKSLQCSDCHKQIFDCTNCHVNGIPHVPPPLGLNCQGCHGQIDGLFKHPTINLTIHNIFHLNSTKDCQMCHNPDSMKSLKLANGDIVPIDQAHNLCKQCHSDIYKLWSNGQHFADKTIPIDVSSSEDPSDKTTWENNWQNQNSCVNCHNPHNPSELYQLPISKTKNVETPSMYIYMIPIIVLIIIIIFISLKYGLKNFARGVTGKISDITTSRSISMPKMPRLSIPISISIDDGQNEKKLKDIDIEKVPSPTFDSLNKKLEKDLNTLVESNNAKTNVSLINRITKILKKFNRGDIYFVSGIIIMFGIFYMVFGTFVPMAVAVSESMTPHIDKGDLVFFTDIGRVDNINTFDNGKINGYKSFENYGDVIIYKPFGQGGVTPIIHRAMYYVNKGDSMWPGGPVAPSDGYITKGDNQLTNPGIDQQSSTSNLQPVKKEWVEGVARFRIPYIGYIRLWI